MRTRSHTRAEFLGQSLAEFAIVFPVIALVAFGFLDVGRAVFAYNTLSNATREATRVAIVNQLDPANGPWECSANKPVEDVNNPHWTFRGCAVDAGASIGVQSADVSITYGPPAADPSLQCGGPISVGCIASITVATHYVPITPVVGYIIGPITMQTTSQMPVERVFP